MRPTFDEQIEALNSRLAAGFTTTRAKVTDPPVYAQTQKVKPLSPEIISEIHRLRAQDVEIAKIAETLGVSKSAVSRILAGKRRRGSG